MIELKNLKKEDFEVVVDWNKCFNEDELLQWAGPIYKHPLTYKQLDDYYRESQFSLSKIYFYRIELVITHQIVGVVELHIEQGNLERGLVKRLLIDEAYQGNGIGEKALKELVIFGFEKCGLKEIQLNVFDFNENAISCYEKVGFTVEKHIKNARKSSKGYWHLYQMLLKNKDL